MTRRWLFKEAKLRREDNEFGCSLLRKLISSFSTFQFFPSFLSLTRLSASRPFPYALFQMTYWAISSLLNIITEA